MNRNVLITGGLGFIGSHFVRLLIKERPEYTVLNLDNISYAGDKARLKDIEGSIRYNFIKGDIRKVKDIEKVFRNKIGIVVHFAAESHVDNSIVNPFIFEEVNSKGTLVLLEAARNSGIKRFVHVSTDEVYGDIENGRFTENSPLRPSSPYSASKAAADLLVKAYIRTYSFPAVIIRPSNNYGPWQYPEKFIPVVISQALQDKKVPVYARGLNVREWLYVEDCVKAIHLILEKGKIGEVYNIGSETERKNIDVAKHILKCLKKKEGLIEFVKDRLGHDFRYALDSSKVKRLGFTIKGGFEENLTQTVRWYTQNFSWVRNKLR